MGWLHYRRNDPATDFAHTEDDPDSHAQVDSILRIRRRGQSRDQRVC